MEQFIGATINVGIGLPRGPMQGQDATYNFQPLVPPLTPAWQGASFQLHLGPIVLPAGPVLMEQMADTRRRLSSFEEDWDAPGMNLYDAL